MNDEEPRGRSGRERGDSLHYWFLTVREQEITSTCRSRFIQVFLMGVHRLSPMFQVSLKQRSIWWLIINDNNKKDISMCTRHGIEQPWENLTKAVCQDHLVHFLSCFDTATSVTQDLDNVFHMHNLKFSPGWQLVRAMQKSLKTSSIGGFLGVRGCSTRTTNTQQMSGWCRDVSLQTFSAPSRPFDRLCLFLN